MHCISLKNSLDHLIWIDFGMVHHSTKTRMESRFFFYWLTILLFSKYTDHVNNITLSQLCENWEVSLSVIGQWWMDKLRFVFSLWPSKACVSWSSSVPTPWPHHAKQWPKFLKILAGSSSTSSGPEGVVQCPTKRKFSSSSSSSSWPYPALSLSRKRFHSFNYWTCTFLS